MQPTSRIVGCVRTGQGVIAGIAIHLQETGIPRQQALRHLGRLGGVIVKQDDRLFGWATPLHPDAGLRCRLPVRFLEYLDTGFVHPDDVVLQQAIPQQVDQRLHQGAQLDHPARQGGPRHLGTDAGKQLLLARQRQGILVLGDRDVGQQPGGGVALGDRLWWQRRRTHRLLATPAGVLGPDVANHLDPGGDDVELLADLLTDAGQAAAATTDLLRSRKVVLHINTRQMIRQRLAVGTAALVLGDRDRRFDVRRGLVVEHFRLVEQPHLRCRLFLAGGAVLACEQPAFLLFQLLDAGLKVAILGLEGLDLLYESGVFGRR
jgi:hypothetical protein